MQLTTKQRDRAAGILVGQACGDALGVPYEFGPALTHSKPAMIGGGLGPYAPGEWSDDTQMAVCVAQVTAEGTLDDATLGRIALAFCRWREDGASDIGNQTNAVLADVARALAHDNLTAPSEIADAARHAALRFTQNTTHSAGNGALMRNGILGISSLNDREQTAANAQNVAALTHADPLVLDSCVLHAAAIRHAVLTGEYDLLCGLDLVPQERRPQWQAWIMDAASANPATIDANGSTFGALRAAHAAITFAQDAEDDGPRIVQHAFEAAASAGGDTDTVAAIAGALVGAVYGLSSIPQQWQDAVHGWPGLRSPDLVALAIKTVEKSS